MSECEMFQIGKTHPHCTDVLQYVCTDLSTGAMIPIMLPGIELKIHTIVIIAVGENSLKMSNLEF